MSNRFAVYADADFKLRIVFSTGFAEEMVFNINIPVALQEFLQTGLGINGVVKPAHIQFREDDTVNKLFHGIAALIQIQSANKSFENVTQQTGPPPSTGHFLTMPQTNVLIKVTFLGKLGKTVFAHHRCPESRQFTLRQLGKTLVDIFRNKQLQNCITQKLDSLIVFQSLMRMLIDV